VGFYCLINKYLWHSRKISPKETSNYSFSFFFVACLCSVVPTPVSNFIFASACFALAMERGFRIEVNDQRLVVAFEPVAHSPHLFPWRWGKQESPSASSKYYGVSAGFTVSIYFIVIMWIEIHGDFALCQQYVHKRLV